MIKVREVRLEFSADWFSTHIENWKKWLAAFKGKPTQVLEIGSFEGRSAIWLCRNILTHPKAAITCVDPFENNFSTLDEFERLQEPAFVKPILLKARSQFIANTLLLRKTNKLRWVDVESFLYLKSLSLKKKFDIIYVDGNHVASAVMRDIILAWPHLNIGGVMILDDYEWSLEGTHSQTSQKLACPRAAIDAFLSVFENRYEIIHKGWQVALRKI